jgi:hypothetical protein
MPSLRLHLPSQRLNSIQLHDSLVPLRERGCFLSPQILENRMSSIPALVMVVEVSDELNQRSQETFLFRRSGQQQIVPWHSVRRRVKRRCPEKILCRLITTYPTWVLPRNKAVFTT